MQEFIGPVPIPSSPQELEQAVQRYKTSDLSGYELLCQWQAIRDASLRLTFADSENDRVPGEDSY